MDLFRNGETQHNTWDTFPGQNVIACPNLTAALFDACSDIICSSVSVLLLLVVGFNKGEVITHTEPENIIFSGLCKKRGDFYQHATDRTGQGGHEKRASRFMPGKRRERRRRHKPGPPNVMPYGSRERENLGLSGFCCMMRLQWISLVCTLSKGLSYNCQQHKKSSTYCEPCQFNRVSLYII